MEETRLNKMPSDEVTFTKEINDYDEGSDERVGRGLALDTVPLHSANEAAQICNKILAPKPPTLMKPTRQYWY